MRFDLKCGFPLLPLSGGVHLRFHRGIELLLVPCVRDNKRVLLREERLHDLDEWANGERRALGRSTAKLNWWRAWASPPTGRARSISPDLAQAVERSKAQPGIPAESIVSAGTSAS